MLKKVNNKKNIFVTLLVCCFMLVATIFTIGSNAIVAKAASDSITIHFYNADDWDNVYVYYWNSKPKNVEVSWPGKKMNEDSNGWYSYTINDVSKVNFLFSNKGNNQTDDLTANKSGDWYYKNGKLSRKNPDASSGGDVTTTGKALGGDFREDSIYFVITTRFYDGYEANNVHCWEDATKAKNPDDDMPWRGDFLGLIEQLDYIKAMGFSAIWITPVVENGSSYDYHGYHAINFKKIDPRYDAPNGSYQDLIDAAHAKGIKIVQDIVLNHTCNFGEENLYPLFEKDYSADLGTVDCMKLTDFGRERIDKVFKDFGINKEYEDATGSEQYEVGRVNVLKDPKYDLEHIYHSCKQCEWEQYSVQQGSIEGDCVDLDTENPEVAQYLRDAYIQYINMGVDAFRVDTVKHISRLTFNKEFNQQFKEAAKANGDDDFYMFGECCSLIADSVWNKGVPAISCPFYTWKESKDYAWGTWEDNTDSAALNWKDNESLSGTFPTSDNAFLNGNEYHQPDYSMNSGLGMIDFPMHHVFGDVHEAFNRATGGDQYYNDSTWNVVYVDSHDYGPGNSELRQRFAGGADKWAENLDLMFTFRGIPCVFYGSEIQFMAHTPIDVGPNQPLSTTGRAYYGDNLAGNVTATDFSEYTASGTVAETLNSPLSKHIQRLNKIRRAIPALQKGQYSLEGCNGAGGIAFKRRFTDNDVDSFVCVTINGGATFTGVPNGTYVDAITGDKKTVGNGTLTTNDCSGQGNMRVYVLNNGDGISEAIGENGDYLK